MRVIPRARIASTFNRKSKQLSTMIKENTYNEYDSSDLKNFSTSKTFEKKLEKITKHGKEIINHSLLTHLSLGTKLMSDYEKKYGIKPNDIN